MYQQKSWGIYQIDNGFVNFYKVSEVWKLDKTSCTILYNLLCSFENRYSYYRELLKLKYLCRFSMNCQRLGTGSSKTTENYLAVV